MFKFSTRLETKNLLPYGIIALARDFCAILRSQLARAWNFNFLAVFLQKRNAKDRDLERLVAETDGYSGSDLQALCEEAAMMPIRELGSNILTVQANQVRGLRYGDFQKAMTVIRPSLQKSKWEELERWNREFGSN
ncbi:UNVERIFIED_CONTAM: hypothetical protein Sradi_0524600 [Sesamum radiatum]|uniref:AAA ATPase AAA+ lid domain-containing protein n=1 Tax=Sesamum radiatum TaxID=300843 RepID=A0AAW2VKN2_SESRA